MLKNTALKILVASAFCFFNGLFIATTLSASSFQENPFQGNLAPDCAEVFPGESVLWPADHKFNDISILGLSDPDGDAIVTQVQCIRQDEPLNTIADGNTEIDGAGVGTGTASVRRERMGKGNGRVYHISYLSTDSRGAKCGGITEVSVPKSAKSIALDDGPLYDSVLNNGDCNTLNINNPPTGFDQALTVNEDTVLPITLTATDPDQNALTFTLQSMPLHGTLEGQAPDLNYVPNENFYGDDTFTFIVNDGQDDSGISTVNVTVLAVNDAPIASAGAYELNEDESVSVAVSATDVDTPQDQISFSIVQMPTHGSLSGDFSSLVYTPNPDFNGSDSFTYVASDEIQESNIATVALNVLPVNDAPLVVDQALTMDQGQTVAITLAGSDVDTGDVLSFSVVAGPANGGLSGTSPNLAYSPNTTFSGVDSFTYKANDGTVDSAVATVTITVIQVDRDNDGVPDDIDAFPDDPLESSDLDGDGVGDNADTDRDGDGVANDVDVFPNDATESADLDGDGIGDNADPDRDGDGVDDVDDFFPDDPESSTVPTVTITTPETLITVGSSPITVTGTIDDPTARLTVNGVEAAHSNGLFEVDVALEEGLNNIVARGIDVLNHEGLATITVSLDKTPPYVTIQTVEEGQTVYSDKIAVGGLVNDIVRGTVTEEDSIVRVNGQLATVNNRYYLAEDVPLLVGENTIEVVASDAVGNVGNAFVTINYEVQTKNIIELVSGQSQSAVIKSPLTAPLQVKLTSDGIPVVDKTVIFRVIDGDGLLQAGLEEGANGALVNTDANGVASVSFNVGSRAGVGNHRVRARAVGFDGEIVFHSTATYGEGSTVGIIAGNNQRGSVRQPLPSPMVLAITDSGANLIPDVEIEWKVTVGTGIFQNGENTYLTKTDKDGRASAHYTLGPEEGLDQQRVTATLVGTNSIAGFTASGFMPGDPGQTSIKGLVLDNQDIPMPNVTIRVEGSSRQAITDDQGQFIITEAPVGPVHLLVEGSTTTREGEWPTLSYNIVTVPGVENPMASPIYLVELDTQSALSVGAEDVEYTLPDMPGFKLKVQAGSVTFPDGSKEGRLSVTPVNANKIPMPPPNGMQPQFIVTIQPHGAVFDPPAELTLPNVDGHLPGAEVEMYSYDHDLEEFVTIGLGTVAKDGSTITSNPGIGVIKAGWHCGSQPGDSGCCEGGGGGNSCDPLCENEKTTGSCPSTTTCEPKAPDTLSEQIPGNCQTETCGGEDNPNPLDVPPEECGICDGGTPAINKDRPLDDQEPDDCKVLLCGGDHTPINETPAIKARGGDSVCLKCSAGEEVPDDSASCDDGLFCTSSDGKLPGPDKCIDGKCTGKEIERTEDLSGSVNYDISGLKSALRGEASTGLCDFGGLGNFSGGIKQSSITECCESTQEMVDGIGLTGTATINGAKVQCYVPAFSWGVATIGVTAGAQISGSVSGSGYATSCDENCNWSIQGSVGVDLNGGIYVSVISRDVLSVTGTLGGGGTIAASKTCDKPWGVSGCVGPPSVSGTVTLGGWYDKKISYQFKDLVACW